MNCISSLCGAETRGAPLPDAVLPGTLPGKRQAAVLCLQAATKTDSEVQRALLRRRAAELILPRLPDSRERRTC